MNCIWCPQRRSLRIQNIEKGLQTSRISQKHEIICKKQQCLTFTKSKISLKSKNNKILKQQCKNQIQTVNQQFFRKRNDYVPDYVKQVTFQPQKNERKDFHSCNHSLGKSFKTRIPKIHITYSSREHPQPLIKKSNIIFNQPSAPSQEQGNHLGMGLSAMSELKTELRTRNQDHTKQYYTSADPSLSNKKSLLVNNNFPFLERGSQMLTLGVECEKPMSISKSMIAFKRLEEMSCLAESIPQGTNERDEFSEILSGNLEMFENKDNNFNLLIS